MKSTLLFFFLSLHLQASQDSFLNTDDCVPEKNNEPFLVTQDFRWSYTLPELLQRFVEIYQSDKRLKRRAYWSPEKKSLVMPFNSFNGGDLVVPLQFARNVAGHIQSGFKENIIDAVFFPDMGHSHLFIPMDRWTTIYDPYEVNQISRFYEKVFQDTSVKFLYHTAEQLKMREGNQLIDNERVQFRYRTRNLVGSTDGSHRIFTISNPESSANTAHELPGHYYYGAGFNLSANRAGCFSVTVNGRVLNFDISMYDLESNAVEFDAFGN